VFRKVFFTDGSATIQDDVGDDSVLIATRGELIVVNWRAVKAASRESTRCALVFIVLNLE
jgi:hypothetical protein